MDEELETLAIAVGRALKERSLKLATAESCTGGWVAQTVTAIAGSSEWFERGFVTYSNDSKREMLGVAPRTLLQYGAVSEEAAGEMAAGALAASHADVALAVTGIAGPGGATPDKPVGTVCFGWLERGHAPQSERKQFAGNREAVRRAAVIHALQGLFGRWQEKG